MKARCMTNLGSIKRPKPCKRVFTGKDKESIIKKWSAYNETAHADLLATKGCVLVFDKE